MKLDDLTTSDQLRSFLSGTEAVVIRYLMKVSGYSRQQITRLVSQYRKPDRLTVALAEHRIHRQVWPGHGRERAFQRSLPGFMIPSGSSAVLIACITAIPASPCSLRM